MLVPSLLFAKSEQFPDLVACSASFVSTFDTVMYEFLLSEDEKPEQQILGSGADYHFIFVIDRSGSMGFGSGRINTAKDAMDLFIRSLPKDCKFSVISFGSNFDALLPSVQDYNSSTSQSAITQIKTFDSNYGGTEILQPL